MFSLCVSISFGIALLSLSAGTARVSALEKCFTYPQTIVYERYMYACKESFGIKVNIVNIQLFDRKESSKWLPHIYYESALFFPSAFLVHNVLFFIYILCCFLSLSCTFSPTLYFSSRSFFCFCFLSTQKLRRMCPALIALNRTIVTI